MQDRVVEFPQRYRLTKVDGTDDVYEIVPAPGEVTEEGTFLNKANLLKDATAALYGFDDTAVLDDVFAKIKTLISTAQSTADGKAKSVKVSWTGVGATSKGVSFGFTPYIVFIWTSFVDTPANAFTQVQTPHYWNPPHRASIYVSPTYRNDIRVSSSFSDKITVSWGSTVTFSSSSEIWSYNQSNVTYYAVAIG